MKRTVHNQIIKIGFLLILFLYPPLCKSFHISCEQLNASESSNRSSHHNDNDCPVCQFYYASYIGTELLELNPVFFYLPFETGFYEKTEYHTPLFSYFLRGPPIQLTRMS